MVRTWIHCPYWQMVINPSMIINEDLSNIHWSPLISIDSQSWTDCKDIFFSLSLSLPFSSCLWFFEQSEVAISVSQFSFRVAFYLPYAWFTLTFNYSYGQEPGFVAGMTFSMVVVAGNALMYLVCSEAMAIHRWGLLGCRVMVYGDVWVVLFLFSR